ncbi:hypothetical protein GPALN_014442 [Globodera pallida]|nr:hypothetical protein GPALN_014442 [Globodera pallida]
MNEINSSCNLEWRIFDFTHMAEGRVRDLERGTSSDAEETVGAERCQKPSEDSSLANAKSSASFELRWRPWRMPRCHFQKAKRKHLLEYADAQYQDYAACQQHMVGLTRDLSSGR